METIVGDVKNVVRRLTDREKRRNYMLSQTEIQNKYEEFYQCYSNKNIDDYEVFVRSRVIEHFFIVSNLAVDEVVYLVNKSVADSCPSQAEIQVAGKEPITEVNDHKIPRKLGYKKYQLKAIKRLLLSFILRRKK